MTPLPAPDRAPRRRQPLRLIGSIVAAGLALLAIGGVAALWATLPPAREAARVAGLSAPVRISFDADGIPWIHAASDLDAATALGFAHARDRMFQMELMRRVASGRLAEIAGDSVVTLDATMRTLGLRRRAEADLPALPAHTRALLAAYSRGVNAWIAARGRFAGPEFVVLGRPEPWTPVDCLLWGKTMALYLSGNYRTELARTALARRVRPAIIDALWPTPGAPLPPTAALPALGRLAERLDTTLPRFPAPFTLPATASNEWAVDGRHSATGAPLLAGDPHLSFGLPSIWYVVRIDTPGATLAGATAPGVPFLIIGHNAHVAWSFTTTGSDTQDVFVETPADATHYLTPTGAAEYDTHDETIRVRGGADRVLHIRQTRHGPVISDLDGLAQQTGQVLAVAMASLQPGDTAAAGLDALNRAPDLAAALRTAPMISSPNQNLLAADAHGIGLAVTGRVPVRAAGDGQVPVDGASGAFDWTGFAEGTQLPLYRAPASGRLVNANEPVAATDFPVFMGRDAFGDWRARRIRALLDAHPHARVADFVAMQNDVTDVAAAELLPVLRAVKPASPLAAKAVALLGGWHGEMTRDRPQPLIFNAWMQRFWLSLLDRNQVPASLAGPRMELLAAVLVGHDTRLCDEACGALLHAALDRSVADLARTEGADPARWRWGRLHRAVFAHPLLQRIPLLGRADHPAHRRTGRRGHGGSGRHGRGAGARVRRRARRLVSRGVRPGRSGPQPVHPDPRRIGQSAQFARGGFDATLARRRHHYTRADAAPYRRHRATLTSGNAMSDPSMTEFVLRKRVLAWLLDVLMVAVLLGVLHLALGLLGLLTFGLGWTLYPLLPLVPFLYSFGSLAGRHAATPGQRLMGVAAVHHLTGQRPTVLEAFVSTAVFWLSLGFAPLLLIGLVTARHRTLHDLLSGLVFIRTPPLTVRRGAWNMTPGRAA